MRRTRRGTTRSACPSRVAWASVRECHQSGWSQAVDGSQLHPRACRFSPEVTADRRAPGHSRSRGVGSIGGARTGFRTDVPASGQRPRAPRLRPVHRIARLSAPAGSAVPCPSDCSASRHVRHASIRSATEAQRPRPSRFGCARDRLALQRGGWWLRPRGVAAQHRRLCVCRMSDQRASRSTPSRSLVCDRAWCSGQSFTETDADVAPLDWASVRECHSTAAATSAGVHRKTHRRPWGRAVRTVYRGRRISGPYAASTSRSRLAQRHRSRARDRVVPRRAWAAAAESADRG